MPAKLGYQWHPSIFEVLGRRGPEHMYTLKHQWAEDLALQEDFQMNFICYGWLWPQDTIYFWHLFILSTVQESASTYILQKKWGLEQKKFLPKVTQPESGRTGFRSQV